MIQPSDADRREVVDRFYWEHGPCCAGCDFWRYVTSAIGTCDKAAPVSGAERMGLLNISGLSFDVHAGHPFTPRDHWCGDFQDTFDWTTLPDEYLGRINANPNASRST